MKLVKEDLVNFDNKKFTVEVSGREVAHIYAGLMNLNGGEFDRIVYKTAYKGREMENTDEIDTQSWLEILGYKV